MYVYMRVGVQCQVLLMTEREREIERVIAFKSPLFDAGKTVPKSHATG
jgi:hypothetical protein